MMKNDLNNRVTISSTDINFSVLERTVFQHMDETFCERSCEIERGVSKAEKCDYQSLNFSSKNKKVESHQYSLL